MTIAFKWSLLLCCVFFVTACGEDIGDSKNTYHPHIVAGDTGLFVPSTEGRYQNLHVCAKDASNAIFSIVRAGRFSLRDVKYNCGVNCNGDNAKEMKCEYFVVPDCLISDQFCTPKPISEMEGVFIEKIYLR